MTETLDRRWHLLLHFTAMNIEEKGKSMETFIF